MIVEIASGNWSTDLVDKQEEYEVLQVPEYWIVDYRGQSPAKYCQRGKGKKVIVLMLADGIYQKTEYMEGEIVSLSGAEKSWKPYYFVVFCTVFKYQIP